MQKFIAILASYGVTGTARVRRGKFNLAIINNVLFIYVFKTSRNRH